MKGVFHKTSFRMTAFVIVALVIAALPSFIGWEYSTRTLILPTFETMIQEKTETTVRNLGIPLTTGNMDLFFEQLGLSTSKFIQLVELVNSEDGVIHYSSGTQKGHAPDAELIARLSREKVESYRVQKGEFVENYVGVPIVSSCVRCHDGIQAINHEGKIGQMAAYFKITADYSKIIELEKSKIKYALLAGVAFAVLLIITLLFVRKELVIPTRRLQERLGEIVTGEGDLSKRLPINDSELGHISHLLNQLMEKITQIILPIKELIGDLNNAANKLSSTSALTLQNTQSVSDRTATVAAAAEKTSVNTDSAAEEMSQSSNSLRAVAHATEEMNTTIIHVAANARKTREISDQAVTQTQDVTKTMNELGLAAQEINKITEAISKISNQTNLLALNATIEAARAGEAGKGFAVVASEIKELARQTASATDDIQNRISGIQQSTASAVSNVVQISEVIQQAGDLVNNITQDIEQQTLATKELSGNINLVSIGVQKANDQVSQTVHVSHHMASEIAEVIATTDELRSGGSLVKVCADDLLLLAENLNTLVNKFKM